MDKVKRTVNTVADKLTKTRIECIINEATTNEPWGVTTTLLNDIADKMQGVKDVEDGMNLILNKLSSSPKQYNRIYKTLNLIEHLLRLGSNRCVTIIRDHAHRIRTLQEFSYRDNDVEKGQGIRDKARIISSYLVDHRLLEHEREQAFEHRKKFMGISSSDYPGQSNSYSHSTHYSNTIDKTSYTHPTSNITYNYSPPEIPVLTTAEPYPDLFNTQKKPQAYIKSGAAAVQIHTQSTPQTQNTGNLFHNLQTKPKSQPVDLLDGMNSVQINERESVPVDIFSTSPAQDPFKIQAKSGLPTDLFPTQTPAVSFRQNSTSLPIDILNAPSHSVKPVQNNTPSTAKVDLISITAEIPEKKKLNMFEGLQPKKKEETIDFGATGFKETSSSSMLPDNLFENISVSQTKQPETFNKKHQMSSQSIYNPSLQSQPQYQPYKPLEVDPFASAEPHIVMPSRVNMPSSASYVQPSYLVPQYQVPNPVPNVLIKPVQQSAYTSVQSQYNPPKMHVNYSDYTGPSITQLQTSPSLLLNKPQETKPKVVNPKEIESAIMNLDNLSLSLGTNLNRTSNPLLHITPSSQLSISYDPTQTNYTTLHLRNASNSSVAFKIKTTSPQDFLVSPSQGSLRTNEDISVRINFKGNEESVDKTHKFLVQAHASTSENASEINWSNPNVQNTKISLSFVRDFRDSVYGDTRVSLDTSARFSADMSTDLYEDVEKHKNELMTESKSLTSTLDKIKTEIEKAKHRLNFSKDLESLHKAHTSKNYSYTHLLVGALVGFLIGAFFMN